MSDSSALPLSSNLALQAAGLGTWQLDSSTQTLYLDTFAQQLLDKPAESDFGTFIKDIHSMNQNEVNEAFQTLPGRPKIDLTFQISRPAPSWIRLWGSVTKEAERSIGRGVIQAVANPADPNNSGEWPSLFDWLDYSPIGLALLDEKDLRFIKVNASFAKLKEKTPDQLLGMPIAMAMPELESLEQKEHLQQALATGTAYRVSEVEIRRSFPEQPAYVDVSYQPQWNSDLNRYATLLIITTDVTLQVQMRKELETQKAKLEHVIQLAPVSIARLTGSDFTLSTVNKAFIEIAGKGPNVLNKPLIEVMPEIEGQPFLALLKEVYTTQQVYEQKALPALIVEKGLTQHKFFDVCYAPLVDKNGQSYGVLCFSIDVTSQIKLQKRMEQSSQSLQNAVDLAQLGTWVMHIRERIVMFSPAVSTWIGMTSALTFEQILALSSQVSQLRRAYLAAVRDTSSGKFEIELEIRHPQSRQKLIFYALGHTQFNEKGQAVQIRGFVREVTAERLMQHKLETSVQERTRELATSNQKLQVSNEALVQTNEHLSRSNESLEQFAFIASHDLQEPLRKIRQFSDLLVKYYEREQVLNEMYVDRIRQSATRMSELVTDLLAFSRISNASPVLKSVNLNRILERVQENLAVSLEETGAELTIDLLPTVLGDSLQLEQLWQNLVSNALKFSSKDLNGQSQKPLIRIRCRTLTANELPDGLSLKNSGYYRISIQDNGVGFEKKYVERIFGVFQRLHGKAEFKGSGIGLAICQKVALNHGGIITAESELGEGALFELYLPV
ncbi:ATP-binding protein [Siphonobacter sp. SORGH_AS_1065]|uniref:PAS domain-containing sensor histidine kinase n=1 Tax=Siphonobacter sp. SORGH_AS_1065 TaxID=3041795 RepID=UPI00277FADF4|nr:ATP-binding protein [Siphonobacter sp. SORGH_AS_1065]MDQ1085482.1 signal transduction histidine kinase [Siphonobacter sp. SORGH_AS_1065]